MASSGPNFPSTIVNDSTVGSFDWTDVTNVNADDGNVATISTTNFTGGQTHYIKGTNFGFSLPAGATIDGISVEVQRNTEVNNFIKDFSVKLVKGGAISGDNKAEVNFWGTSETTITYGGLADLWGLALTQSDVNASGFGVVFSVQDSETSTDINVNVDFVRITIEHTEGTPVTGTGYQSASGWF